MSIMMKKAISGFHLVSLCRRYKMRSENERVYAGGGVGFFGLLTIVLIVLKLCGVITWAWVWVLFGPFLASIFLTICIVGLVIGCAILASLVDNSD